MDPKLKPLMPEIKAEVNKVDDGGKKKATGLLGGLFGSGGTGAAGGLGGLGAGAAGGGGLLATKAGMLALVIVGSSVAGGIGLAGYKMFGPGASDQTGGNLSLFAPKPQQNFDGSGVAPVAADGSSQSLSLMAQSAAKDKAADASASGDPAPTDNTAGSGASDAAAAEQAASNAAAAGGGAINSGGGAGATGTMGGGLTGVKKLGALSGATGSSGGSVSSASGASSRLGDNIANAARNGGTSAFSKGGAGSKSSSARGMASRRGTSARSQARAVMGDQAKGRAGSSFAAGRTYDGSAANNGGAIGPDGSAISMGGAGDGGNAQPKALSASKRGDSNEQEVPPPGDGKAVVTEWEKNIKKVQMLAMLAVALAFLAKQIKYKDFWGYGRIITQILGAVIMAIGVAIGVIAGQILNGVNGEPGQKTPGMLSAVAALAVIGVGVWVMSSAPEEPAKEATVGKAAVDNVAANGAATGTGTGAATGTGTGAAAGTGTGAAAGTGTGAAAGTGTGAATGTGTGAAVVQPGVGAHAGMIPPA